MKRLAVIVVVLSAVFAASAHAEDFVASELGPPLQTTQPVHLPIIDSLEALAQSYWADRGITIPTPVEVFVVPPTPGALALGEESGRRVWITEPLLAGTHSAHARGGRLWLCESYLHERGHNAGLTHSSPFSVMRPDWMSRPPRCLAWARLYGEANGAVVSSSS